MAYVFKTEQEAVQAYNESLDMGECVEICGLVFEPSRIVRELDPTAYRCGFIDWLDSYITDGEVPEEAEGWSVDNGQ